MESLVQTNQTKDSKMRKNYFESKLLLKRIRGNQRLLEDDEIRIINIRLMEIYTTNLLNFSVQENRLQNNFEVIEASLKQLQQQVAMLNKQQEMALQSILQNKHQIENVSNKTQKHHSLLHEHKNWIEQLNSQFSGFDGTLINENDSENEHNQNRDSKRKSKEQTSNGHQSVEKKANEMLREASKGSEKNGFQQMVTNIKQRLRTLEKDSEQKDSQIEELKKYLTIRRNRESEQQSKRGSAMTKQYVSKNSGSKKDLKHSSMLIELKENENEQKSENNQLQNQFTTSLDRTQRQIQFSSNNMQIKIQDKVSILYKDLEKMKQAFAEKNRILDAHMKENHQKVQNMEKNMDILERSHDMLKYDFERTSTSFSKTRPTNETHEQKVRRAEQRLNDTRITNKQYYEEKLIELFNEMDFLKGEYFQLQTKIEKDVQDEPEDDSNERRIRIAHKLLSSKNQSDESLKKQLIKQKNELKKLREEFEEFTFGVNTGTNEIKTILIKPNENKEDWKSLSTKMQKLKMDVQSGIRQLQGKIVTSNEMIVGINQLQVGIEECKLLLKKKVESTDFEKSNKRIEARLNNFIMQIFEKQGQQSEFDAAIAKQPWFCLSCDSQLKNYSGKAQKSNGVSEKLAGRKVNPESHMVRRNDNGRLPSVLK